MATIRVAPANDAGNRFAVEVYANDGHPSEHDVGVSDPDWERFGGGFETRADLVEASFRFLLEREPKDSILRSFELGVIARYFPEYAQTFSGRAEA